MFADVGTSVYYTPGILYQQVGSHAALFVDLTFVVFVLLAIKYAEVAIRYPEGGGVVTVATRAIHPNIGLLGGLFILVDYFLTSGLSATSGVIYLSLVFGALKPLILPVAVAALIGLGLINVIGVRASAAVTAAFAVLAAVGQLAVVVAVVLAFGPAQLVAKFPEMLSGPHLGPVTILTGYAGAFLAFSGLESISQLAPAMKAPHRRVSRMAMLWVVLSLLVTSPLLTLWSTTLLKPGFDPNQGVSLLAGLVAGPWLQGAIAVSAALLLVFACNTAIIGCYHVFIALSRMRFLPRLLQATNRWRETPHWAILAATGVPIVVVIAVGASTGLLGDLYAFGLLGAFCITSVSLDIVRWHERGHEHPSHAIGRVSMPLIVAGVATSVLVIIPWLTNLVAKPLATAFGGGVVLIGLGVAYLTSRLETRRGRYAVFPKIYQPGSPLIMLRGGRRMTAAAVLAILPSDPIQVGDVIARALDAARGRPVTFSYQGGAPKRGRAIGLFEVMDPYADDENAQAAFHAAEVAARASRTSARYVYIPEDADPGAHDWVREQLKAETVVTA